MQNLSRYSEKADILRYWPANFDYTLLATYLLCLIEYLPNQTEGMPNIIYILNEKQNLHWNIGIE